LRDAGGASGCLHFGQRSELAVAPAGRRTLAPHWQGTMSGVGDMASIDRNNLSVTAEGAIGGLGRGGIYLTVVCVESRRENLDERPEELGTNGNQEHLFTLGLALDHPDDAANATDTRAENGNDPLELGQVAVGRVGQSFLLFLSL